MRGECAGHCVDVDLDGVLDGVLEEWFEVLVGFIYFDATCYRSPLTALRKYYSYLTYGILGKVPSASSILGASLFLRITGLSYHMLSLQR